MPSSRPTSLNTHQAPNFATLAQDLDNSEEQRQRGRRQRRHQQEGEHFSAACDTPLHEELWERYPSWATGAARKRATVNYIQSAASRFPVVAAPVLGSGSEQDQSLGSVGSELLPNGDRTSSTAAQVSAPSRCPEPVVAHDETRRASRHVIATLDDPESSVVSLNDNQNAEPSVRDSGPIYLSSEATQILATLDYGARIVSDGGSSLFLASRVAQVSASSEDDELESLGPASTEVQHDQVTTSCNSDEQSEPASSDSSASSPSGSGLIVNSEDSESSSSDDTALVSTEERGPLSLGELQLITEQIRAIRVSDSLRLASTEISPPQSAVPPEHDGAKVSTALHEEVVLLGTGPGLGSRVDVNVNAEQDRPVPATKFNSLASRQSEQPLLQSAPVQPSRSASADKRDGRFRSWGRSLTKSMSKPFRRWLAAMKKRWNRHFNAKTSRMRHWRRYRKEAYRSGQVTYDRAKAGIAKRRAAARHLLRKRQRLMTERQRANTSRASLSSRAFSVEETEVRNFSYPIRARPGVEVVVTPQEALPTPQRAEHNSVSHTSQRKLSVAASSTLAKVGERVPIIRWGAKPQAPASERQGRSAQATQRRNAHQEEVTRIMHHELTNPRRAPLAQRIEAFKPAELASYNDLVRNYNDFSIHRDALCETLHLAHKDLIKLYCIWGHAYHDLRKSAKDTGEMPQSMAEIHAEKILICMRDAIESFRFWEGKVARLRGNNRCSWWLSYSDLTEMGKFDLATLEKEVEMFSKYLEAVKAQRDVVDRSMEQARAKKRSHPSVALGVVAAPQATPAPLPPPATQVGGSSGFTPKRNQQRRKGIPDAWKDDRQIPSTTTNDQGDGTLSLGTGFHDQRRRALPVGWTGNETTSEGVREKTAPELNSEDKEKRLNLTSFTSLPEQRTTSAEQRREERWPGYVNLPPAGPSLLNGTPSSRRVDNGSMGRNAEGSIGRAGVRNQGGSIGRAAGRAMASNSTSANRPPSGAPTEPRAMRAANGRSTTPSYAAPTAASLRNTMNGTPASPRSYNSTSLGRRGGQRSQPPPARSIRPPGPSGPGTMQRQPRSGQQGHNGRRAPS